jgi:hypothetical protein
MIVRRILVSLAVLVALAVAAPAAGAWQLVSEHNGGNTDEASAVRGADGVLHIVYRDVVTGTGSSLRYRTLSATGVLGTPETAIGPWNGFTNPDIELVGGVPNLFFSGLENTDSSNPHNSGQSWTVNRGSGTWTAAAPVTSSHTPYSSSQVSSVLDGSGQPWTSSSTTFDVLVHTGFATTGTEANYGPDTSCCGYGSNVGVGSDGRMFLAYFSNATDRVGYWMRQLAPAVGAPTRLPDLGQGSISRGARLPMATRTTGGVYTAYCDTYPGCTALRVTAVGHASLRLRLADAQIPQTPDAVWLAAAPSGRMWLVWVNRSGMFATRSNKALTRWAPVQRIALPAHTDTPFALSGNGAAGPLDVLANIAAGSPTVELRIWHQRIRPTLQITPVAPLVHSNMTHTVRLRLVDAGDPVRGGTIRLRGVSHVTNALGYATFTVPMGTRSGSYLAVGSAAGYVSARGTVRVHHM